ncbi:hypothetical protein [Methylophilus sp. 14]|uniref:hypothetical protein n=1 Tax=Methylophilus sp. 14 TaxID=2781019 RepID=UPI00188F20E5|nr:hypothetical protein [Methylophilus sp. 14]MBF4988165.1 hypothetical protein [Methylophilus sp. 14]
MASIAITADSVSALKKELRFFFPEIKSSHLSEAIAVALDRKTHASLINDINKFAIDPPIELLNEEAFFNRLVHLGYQDDPEFSFEGVDIPEVISTIPMTAFEIEYKSKRQLAWRNLMVVAINEGINQKIFSLRPEDNRWINGKFSHTDHNSGHIFDFHLPNDLPGRCYVKDIGFDELAIHVAVNPRGNILKAFNAKFDAGDAFAYSWLERRKGAWLQTSNTLSCRNSLLDYLAGLSAVPKGFGDKGRVIM